MLDKLLFNNQIISNKKRIHQARVQTINKLVQKVRKLRILREMNPTGASINDKLNKIPTIMACVKKLKASEIVRQILLLSKKPSAILTNGQALPEDIAVAMLASNKFLADFVAKLVLILNLNDENPGWKTEMLESSKRKKKLLKEGKPKRVGKETAPKKAVVKKPIPWKEEDIDTAEVVDTKDDVGPARGWRIVPLKKVVKEVSAKAKFPAEQPKRKSKLKANDKHSPQQTIDNTVTTVDTFFFTKTGDNYVSAVVAEANQSDKEDEKPRSIGVRKENSIKPVRDNKPRKQWSQNGRLDKRQSSMASLKRSAQHFDEKLHPSWVAKQKLKPTITQFKGQKITFGDDGAQKVAVKRRAHEKPSKNTQSELNLHPSWAAKQKLKPSITAFKGKKTTFDDI